VTSGEFAARIGARPCSRGWRAPCPSHGSQSATLSIGNGRDGRVLLRCFGGCEPADVVASLGLKMRDLMPPREHASWAATPRRARSSEDIRFALRAEECQYRKERRIDDGERLVHADIIAIRHVVAVRLGVSLSPVQRRVSDSFAGGRERDKLWPLLLERAWFEAWIITTGSPAIHSVDQCARLGRAGIAALEAAERRAASDLRAIDAASRRATATRKAA